MKISLVFPRTKYISGDPPLGSAYIASYARKAIKDLDINILDSTFHRSLDYIYDGLKYFRPDITGIFVDTLMYDDAIHVAEFAKSLGSFVVTGGPHATVAPDSLVGKSDIVVRGEGEEAFLEIIKAFESGRSGPTVGIGAHKIIDLPKNYISDLDSISFPAFDLLEMDKYLKAWNYLDTVSLGLKGTTMITSRGCPFKCSYCQPTINLLFGSRLRRRTPEDVVKEMEYLINKFSIGGVFFHDDTFTLERQWVLKFCELLTRRNIKILWGCNSRINTVDADILEAMHKAGLRNIHFGIESGSQRVLDDIYQKGVRLNDVEKALTLTRKIGIKTLGFFMIGAPGETLEEAKATISLAIRLPLNEATFSITTPLVGTFLYENARSSSEYEISRDFHDFDYYKGGAIKKGTIPVSKLRYLQKIALVRFYLSPRRFIYILRHLFTLNGLKKLFAKIRRFY